MRLLRSVAPAVCVACRILTYSSCNILILDLSHCLVQVRSIEIICYINVSCYRVNILLKSINSKTFVSCRMELEPPGEHFSGSVMHILTIISSSSRFLSIHLCTNELIVCSQFSIRRLYGVLSFLIIVSLVFSSISRVGEGFLNEYHYCCLHGSNRLSPQYKYTTIRT